jgi:penicillin-binding protein 2
MLNPGFRIGKQGVEKAFDIELRGRPGAQKVEVDANGHEVRQDTDGDIPAIPGKEIQLTLDLDMQLRAEEVFGAESGAAVVMDVRNGDVLCMFSGPSFDANRFVKGLSGAEYRALAEYERKPLFNKALTATFPAGSTFKTMVAMAALEKGVSPDKTHTCSGAFPFGGHVFHCDAAHGTLNMHQAIVTSCDIFFYNTALEVGPDLIAATARKFGINQLFDELHIPQKRGTLPDIAWKERTFHERWWPGETPSFGIGQGALAVTPLQLCVMTSRLANGRKALMPRLIKSIGGKELPRGNDVPDLPVDPQHVAFVRKAMADVVTSGTAARTGQLGLGPVMMAGKTGTAQAHTYTAGRATLHLDWAMRDHAWFVAFAPVDDPRYAMSVLVEHGGWGASAAAPRAREIMRVALLKDPEVRARIEHPLPMPALDLREAEKGTGDTSPRRPETALGAPTT